jgi:type I restriction enzyme S subunit
MAAMVNRDDRFALAQRVICLSPNPDLVLGGYLFRALLSTGVQESLKSASTGSTVLGIKASSLKEIRIPLPPLPEQERIVAELDAEAARIEAVRGLIPAFEAKIQRVLARVWGTVIEP